jgi:hypothetical protein
MQCILPFEFKAPKNQEVYSDFDESEWEELAASLSFASPTVFDKPERHRHLKALYIKGHVDGKPMGKILVDGGASVNPMPHSTFRKLGKTSEDLIKTDTRLRDFGGNLSETQGAINVELTIESKTLITTFFVIDGKGFYSLLLGRDWIHTNYCVPSTMHQCVIQWIDNEIEVIPDDDAVSISPVDHVY